MRWVYFGCSISFCSNFFSSWFTFRSTVSNLLSRNFRLVTTKATNLYPELKSTSKMHLQKYSAKNAMLFANSTLTHHNKANLPWPLNNFKSR